MPKTKAYAKIGQHYWDVVAGYVVRLPDNITGSTGLLGLDERFERYRAESLEDAKVIAEGAVDRLTDTCHEVVITEYEYVEDSWRDGRTLEMVHDASPVKVSAISTIIEDQKIREWVEHRG